MFITTDSPAVMIGSKIEGTEMGIRPWKPVKKPGARRMREWKRLGEDQPIEPLNAGLLRILSRPKPNQTTPNTI